MSKDVDKYIKTEEQEFYEKKAAQIKQKNKLTGCVFFIIAIAVGVFFFAKADVGSLIGSVNLKKPKQQIKTVKPVADKPVVETKVAIDAADTAVKEEDESMDENLVVLNVESEGRANPFTPYREKSLYIMNNIDEALLEGLPAPSENLQVDSSAKKLYELKISGLLYDKNKSSAIVNIEGKDYLVHNNDKLFGFEIVNIAKDNVEVKYGTNSYQLRIGEILAGNIVENNTYNINHKFSGKELPDLENIKFLAEEE